MIEISVDSRELEGEIVAMMQRYAQLPKAVARTHAQASMRRTIRDGVKVLRRNTPPLSGGKRGRRRKGEKRSTGALRRAVTTKAKYVAATSPKVYGVLGYRASFESRKAIWHEFGTSRGLAPRRMMDKTMGEYGGPAADRLVRELAIGLEKAARDKRMEIVADRTGGR